MLAGAAQGSASAWTCRYADLVRHVEVVYPQAPASSPCEVVYRKPTEQEPDRTLWQAQQNGDFCVRKAVELARRLESWGWQCTGGPSRSTPAGPEQPAAMPTPEAVPRYTPAVADDAEDVQQSGYFVSVADYLAFDRASRLAFVSGVVDSRLRLWRWDLLAAGYNGSSPDPGFADWRAAHVARLDACAGRYTLPELVREFEQYLSTTGPDRGRDKREESAATQLQAFLAWFCRLHG
jgi:hypothetical protein